MSGKNIKVYHNYRSNIGTFEVKILKSKSYKPKEIKKDNRKKITPEFYPEFQ